MTTQRTLLRSLTQVLTLLLVASMVLAQGTPGDGAKPAATVNGEPISQTEVKLLVEIRPPVVPLTDLQKKEMRQAALDMLVDDLLMRQFLRKNAPAATPAAIDKELAE